MNQLDHSYFQQRLSAYADGEVETSVRAQVEEHLRACPECRKSLQEIEKLSEFIAQESGLAESDYWERAAQRIERAVEAAQPKIVDLKAEQARRGASPWWWRAPAIAASVLFLGYLTIHESSILRDEVLTPAQPSGIKTAPVESTTGAELEMEAPGSPMVSPDRRDTALSSASPAPRQEGGEEPAGRPEVQPEPAPAEKAGRQESGLSVPENIEINKSIISPSEIHPVDQSKVTSSPDLTETVKPAVAPPTESLGKKTAKSAQSVEKPVSDAEEQNYRARNREKETIVLRDTLHVTPDLYSVEKPEETGLLELQYEELTYWRGRRDSLAQQIALIRQQDASPIGQALKYAEAPARTSFKATLSGEDPRQKIENQTEAGLLESWYQVCRLTSDSSEINQGVSFIKKVAADQESTNRETAQDYLKQLGRH
jgi:hypothetical protein